MRIDAHHHVWDLAVRDQPWTADLPLLRRSFEIEELAPDLSAHHIDATIVVQTVPVAQESPELLAVAAAHPMIAGVVGWVDLPAADVADSVAELRGAPGGDLLVGIRHTVQDEADSGWLERADVRRGLTAVGDAGLVFDLLVTAAQLDAAVHVARDLPGVGFVLDHAGKPLIQQGFLDPWRRQIGQLAQLTNVVVKVSGLMVEAGNDTWTVDILRPYIETLLQEFGPARMMYGSDWPVCLLAGTYSDVIGATEELVSGLSPAEQADLFGETARRWYHVETR